MKVAKALSDAFADTGWGQGGDRVGHDLLSVVGVVSKFGPPKSHEISLELVDDHHLHLGGVSHFEKPFSSRRSRGYIQGTLYPVSPFVRFAIVTSTGVPTKLDQSGLVHPSCC